MENKKCNKCDETKPFSEFYKSPNGYRSICKSCFNGKSKKYYNQNIEHLKKYKKDYRDKNSESILQKEKNKRQSLSFEDKQKKSEYYKNWRLDNLEKTKKYEKMYYLENKDKVKERSSNYRRENSDKIKEYREKNKENRNYKRRCKMKEDNLYRLEYNIRKMLHYIFKNYGFSKKSKTVEVLGCSFEEFKLYIESKFEPWMNWENKGLYNGELNYGWDLDHIIPVSSAITEDDIIRLNHYTNFQPLCGYVNRCIKRDLIDVDKL